MLIHPPIDGYFGHFHFCVIINNATVDIYIQVFVWTRGGTDGKVSAYNAGDPGSIPGSGRSPGEGNGTPLQYSCLENPMDGGAWEATVHGVAKSRTRLSDFTFVWTYGYNWVFYLFTELTELTLCLSFCGTTTLFSKMAVPFYIPTSNIWGSNFFTSSTTLVMECCYPAFLL